MSTSAPPRGLIGDASAEYIETHMQIREDVRFSKEMDTFLLEEDVEEQEKKVAALWDKTANDQANLFKAMKKYQEKIARKDLSAAKINLETCSWQDVVGEFKRAKDVYKEEQRGKGIPEIITKCFRKLGENAEAFGQWINLLPNGDYGAGICGALKLILGAIRRADDIRNEVYQGIEDIPDAVSKARRYREIYNDVKAYQLSQKSATFFSSVLNAFEKIIIVLTEPGLVRFGKSLLQGDKYSDAIIESIRKVKSEAIEIEKEAELCFEARLRKMDEKQEYISRRQEEMDDRQKELNERQEQMSKLQEEMNERQKEMNERQKQMDEQDKKNNAVIANLYHKFFLSSEAIDRRTRQPYKPPIEYAPAKAIEDVPPKVTKKPKKHRESKPPKESFTVGDLLAILDYDHDMPSSDINHCRLDGEKMSLAEKDLVSHIARSDAMRLWLLNAKESASLLIMGNTTDPNAFTSPLSFLVAELAELYADTEASTTISYFCGLHVDARKEAFADARGIVLSLLTQLVLKERYKGFKFGFMSDELVERVKGFEVEALCEVFKTLVLQIKDTSMLLCFVDTISIYETRPRRAGTRVVLEMLRELVGETRTQREEQMQGVVFKVLVTDPGISCEAMKLFKEEVFVVGSFVDGGRQGIVDMEGLEPDETY